LKSTSIGVFQEAQKRPGSLRLQGLYLVQLELRLG